MTTDFASNDQKVNFSLTDGNNLPFQIKKIDARDANNDGDTLDVDDQLYDEAEIIVRPGVALTDRTYEFDLSANELGNPAENTDALGVKIIIAVDNTAPVFGSGLITEATVAEDAGEVLLATFSATDINNQALIYRIDEGESDAPADILDNLDLDVNSGELKTGEDGVPFDEGVEDDPDTEDVDESEDGDNEHMIVITVSDGTLVDEHVFTLTVTYVEPPPRGEDLNFMVPESQSEEVSIGPFEIDDATGGYAINEQIDGSGVRSDGDDSLFKVDDDGTDPSIGQLYLKMTGTLDFESADVSNNYTLSVSADGPSNTTVIDLITIMVTDVNEAPEFSVVDRAQEVVDGGAIKLYVLESAATNEIVKIGQDAGGNPATRDAQFVATDEDTKDAWDDIAYSLLEENDDGDLVAFAGEFSVDAHGNIRVSAAMLDTDADESVNEFNLVLRASDPNVATLNEDLSIQINIIDTNVAPEFIAESRAQTHKKVSEGAPENYEIFEYIAEDEDGDAVRYRLRDQDDSAFFVVEERMVAHPDTTKGMVPGGVLKVGPPATAGENTLDYEVATTHTVEVQAYDTDGDTDEIVIEIEIENENDNQPAFGAKTTSAQVVENTARDHVLGTYTATDADGDAVSFGIDGADGKSFRVVELGLNTDGEYVAELRTLESLDADSGTPCDGGTCDVQVVAKDGLDAHDNPVDVRITVLNEEDSVSTLKVTKANPVPGPGQGKDSTSFAGTKTSMSAAVHERPGDLPATSYYGVEADSPKNFVETEWANWGTVLRIAVTSQSPDANCGKAVANQNNNQCVVVTVKSDSADDVLELAAYRSSTDENEFVATVLLVELEAHASNYDLDKDGDEILEGIYKHQRVRNVQKTDDEPTLQVPRLQVDEEDEIEVEFGNLRDDIDVENEPPEITNFAPEHEDAFDDPDVEYTFTVTDDNSGLPEPEDLPDTNGDADYMPAVGLVSDSQCEIADNDDAAALARATHVHEDMWLDCGAGRQDGEYIATEGGYGFAPIRDDKDFDEIDDGFDVETTLVLVKNQIFYVTYIVCDNAGNCTSYDPDGNDDEVELAEITIDTEVPDFVEARTGVKWDSGDNEYDDDRSFIQVIFDDLTALNDETVEIDDFVVEGHTIKDVFVYSPDDDDTAWGDDDDGTSPSRYAAQRGPKSAWGDHGYLYRKINRSVFLELEDELLADETPDVTIVPNGIEDQAQNEQDDGDQTAEDWIAPAFTIVSIIAPDTPEGASNQLAGDGDQVTVTVTSDERLDQTRPDVEVWFVDASSVDTGGKAVCEKADGTDGKRKRGEIVSDTAGETWEDCANNGNARGDDLNNNIEKVSNTEWVVTVVKPADTGYYSFYIFGADRSKQKNEGSEGVNPAKIVTDFFDSDGDVNTDDAWFWEADINIPNPNVRVSGVAVTDNEASVEYRSPLFVEIDFTENHWDVPDCEGVDNDDDRSANCMNENSEYAEDSFDDVVITSFMLDDVDVTDTVRTTDQQTFLVSLQSISIGDHTVTIQAMDEAGNELEDALEIDFEVNDRDPFSKRLSPGWNLVSLPGEPADSSIAAVFGADVEVRTVYTYNPVIPGGWMVAVRETLNSDWQGDLTEISAQNAYWVLSDAIQDWEVSIPRLAGGAVGTGTPIQPPVIPLYAGWNLIPVIDISGDGEDDDTISAHVYLEKLGDGLDLARVLGYNTIMNQWVTILDPDMQMNNNLGIGEGYWVFVRQAASLVPSGVVSGGGSD